MVVAESSCRAPFCDKNHRFPWGPDFGGGKVNGWLQEKMEFCSWFGGGGVLVSLKVNCRVSRSDELRPSVVRRARKKARKSWERHFRIPGSSKGMVGGCSKKEYVSLYQC